MNKEIFAVFSKIFLCTSPFALFCSRNGNGGALFLVFLILGGICAWIGHGGLEPTLRVKPKDWWETQFRHSIALKKSKELSNQDVKDSLKWADYITSSNKLPMPTEKSDHIDRIQFGKYYLMEKEIKKMEKENFGSFHDDWRERNSLTTYMGHLCREISYCNLCRVTFIDYDDLRNRFGMDKPEKVWNLVLSNEERREAAKWTKETIERITRERRERIPTGDYYEYQKKYGFRVYRKDLL